MDYTAVPGPPGGLPWTIWAGDQFMGELFSTPVAATPKARVVAAFKLYLDEDVTRIRGNQKTGYAIWVAR